MAPISSGSSTWTSSGIPFSSFVSMATGIGPSSSGSQATVASVVTSTLLAGLGFSGGVISSFPSSVWPSRGPTTAAATTSGSAGRHNPANGQLPSSDPAAASPAQDGDGASATDGERAEDKDDKASKGEGEEGDEGEEEEEEEKEDESGKKGKEKKKAHTNGTATDAEEHPTDAPDSTAKEKGPRGGGRETGTAPPSGPEDHAETQSQSPTDEDMATPTSDPRNDTHMVGLAPPEHPSLNSKPTPDEKSFWPFAIHTGELSSTTHSTPRTHV